MSDVASEEVDDRAVVEALTDAAPILHFARWAVDTNQWAWRLLSDPTFAVEMRLCKEWGIPHSEFLDRWDEVDRAKAIAYHLHEVQRCGSCGVHPDEWDREEYPPPFVLETRVCPGCEELSKWQRHQQEQTKKSPSFGDGVKPFLRRTREG